MRKYVAVSPRAYPAEGNNHVVVPTKSLKLTQDWSYADFEKSLVTRTDFFQRHFACAEMFSAVAETRVIPYLLAKSYSQRLWI